MDTIASNGTTPGEKESTSHVDVGHIHDSDGSPSSEKQANGDAPEVLAKPVAGSAYATTFLTQLQYLCGREWKTLKRDKTLFLTHVLTSAVLGVFCGGLYFDTGITISGFQSRVGCLFFLVRSFDVGSISGWC